MRQLQSFYSLHGNGSPLIRVPAAHGPKALELISLTSSLRPPSAGAPTESQTVTQPTQPNKNNDKDEQRWSSITFYKNISFTDVLCVECVTKSVLSTVLTTANNKHLHHLDGISGRQLTGKVGLIQERAGIWIEMPVEIEGKGRRAPMLGFEFCQAENRTACVKTLWNTADQVNILYFGIHPLLFSIQCFFTNISFSHQSSLRLKIEGGESEWLSKTGERALVLNGHEMQGWKGVS